MPIHLVLCRSNAPREESRVQHNQVWADQRVVTKISIEIVQDSRSAKGIPTALLYKPRTPKIYQYTLAIFP
jgi:hypothetical protein